MKKLLGILVLGLLWCSISFADTLKNVELHMAPECGNIEVKKSRIGDSYIFNISNLSNKMVEVDVVTFLTKDGDRILIEVLFSKIKPYHKKALTVSAPGLLHDFVKTIILNCNTKK